VLTGSAGLVEAQIKNWVRQHVCAVSKDHGRCKKVMIRHLNVERKPVGDVHTINITSDAGVEGTEIADRIINEIADAALRDANDVRAGVQTYAIYAYYTNDANYVPRKIFRAAADEDSDPEAGGMSEPPTEKGLVSQLMRHNEITSKNSLVAMGYIIQTFQKEVEQQRAMNRNLLDQQIQTAMLIQDVTNDAHDRRLKEKRAEMEMSMLEGGFEHLKVILPIIANKIAGKEIVPGAMPKEMYLLASLLENLSPQQQTILRDMLSPQQIAVLAELLGTYEEKKAKLIGESPQADGEQDGGKKTNGALTTKPPNRLVALFEKRSTLINEKDSRFEIKDPVMRKIEERAAKIKNRLSDSTKTKDDEPKQ